MTIKRSIKENVNSAYNSYKKVLESAVIDLCKQIMPDGGKIDFVRPVMVNEIKAKNNDGEFFSFMTETKVFTSIYWFENCDYFGLDGIGYSTSSFMSPDSLLAIYNAVCEVVRRTE